MEIPIYRGEPLFVGNQPGSWWSPFPEKAQGYRRNPFYGHFENPLKSGNPGKILKAKTNLDDFREAMRRVIVKHHTNKPNPAFVMPDRPYRKMSVADAFKQLDKDIDDLKAGKTTLEKLSKTNALFREGYFTGKLGETLKPRVAWGQTLKPLIGPLADTAKEAVKTVGKGALRAAGPLGAAYGALEYLKGSPANEGEEEALRRMRNKVYNKAYRGPLSD